MPCDIRFNVELLTKFGNINYPCSEYGRNKQDTTIVEQILPEGCVVRQPYDETYLQCPHRANPYDAFMLEDDGRIDEKIFDEYMELHHTVPGTL